MKILLDENLPVKLKFHLSEFDTFTVRDMKWNSFKNGILLQAAEIEGFDYFITSDKNLQYQQNIKNFNMKFIILDLLLLKWSIIEPLIPTIKKIITENNENMRIIIIPQESF
jgi:predicted nuclease of predicted toxin-antitoxin system